LTPPPSAFPSSLLLPHFRSLFDFIFPGKLGTLPVFQAQFALPIQIGGYANASPLQVQAAYKCAVLLRDLISPYLLRRRKADVGTSLPPKTEQVLFCSLSETQRELYRSYLASRDLADIMAGGKSALAGIDVLRKICNHPDLLERGKGEGSVADYGASERSGKLAVAERVMTHWRDNGHK
jgi:DNA excision repair protein ERCC-6